jgi:hypothetical protein
MAGSIDIKEVRRRLSEFSYQFRNAHDERSNAQRFQHEFLKCFGLDDLELSTFEMRIKNAKGNTGFIDGYVRDKLLIEMKSTGVNLDKALTQALEYANRLEPELMTPFILVSDFENFHLYDIINQKMIFKCLRSELSDNAEAFMFLTGNAIDIIEESPVNIKAANAITKLHDLLYRDNFRGRDLEVFLTRLLFCLFADDTGIFGEKQQFTHLLMNSKKDGTDLKGTLETLFEVLNQPTESRSPRLPEAIHQFAYVNGDLFKEKTNIPYFDGEVREALLACDHDIDWSKISPAIFGSMFQSVLDTQPSSEDGKSARKELGAHYTSERNIRRVIDPLFFDELDAEFEAILKLKLKNKKLERLLALHDKITNIKVLDPACGCGNFLVVTYKRLRHLEHKIIEAIRPDKTAQQLLNVDIKVSVDQFYGIEIDEAAAHIARVSMYIADEQMNQEARHTLGFSRATVPITASPHIICANALELDWNELIPAQNLNYIVGNPPFLGKNFRTKAQEASQEGVFKEFVKGWKSLDFVSSWFFKAAQFVQHSTTRCALVSTNSITMGEQVATLWQPILELGIEIDFAHKTFQWSNDAKGQAAVHCVIIGFSRTGLDKPSKTLFNYPNIKGDPIAVKTKNINPYLIDAPNIVINNRTKPLGDVSPMVYGNKPVDGGFLFLAPEEKIELLNKYPQLERWIKPILGSDEFLNNGERYCLWLAEASTKELRELNNITEIQHRIEGVKQMRLKSPDKGANKLAETPWKFRDTRTPDTYILVPRVSSERREYVPMGFFDSNTISSDANQMIPNATLYEFAILTSQIHMDWMRVVAGRLKSDYRYSAKLVYNNFPWPASNEKQKSQIEKLAQKILDARQAEFDLDSTASLADLYDPRSMPIALRKAHQALDKAVDKLYRDEGFNSPEERVTFLFNRYNELLQP